MGRRLFLLISLILSFNSLLRSQVILVASAYEGCDSLSTRVFIEPQEVYDTLTDIIWEVREEIISSDDTLKLDLDAPGFYTVKAILNNQYVFSLSRDIQVYSTPRVDFSHSDTLAGNEFSYVFRSEFEESDSLNYIYTWYVNDEVIGYEPLIIHEFPESGEYTIGLSIENSAGCMDSLSKKLSVSRTLECPNVFTPNEDGRNDFFRVETDGNTIYDFRIYSRSGVKIYHTESPRIFWDGRSMSGIKMQPGIYYYTIDAINLEDFKEKTGFIHLYR